jgi:ABC-type multidrug transport system fused ATPase/permease subunit
VGIVGRTGSGKTTIGRLLFRFADPDAGQIRLGGVPLTDMATSDVRNRIGFVPQDVQIIHATVRDNLTFFDTSVSDDQITTVLAELGLGEWLDSLPSGLSTVLPGGDGGLSAGHAQLLALARVFLRDPQVVVLDEATSRLDPATERTVDHAIDRLLDGRTALVIAHRLATIQRVDRIVYLDAAQVVEQGDRAALAADPDSRFARLMRAGLEQVTT